MSKTKTEGHPISEITGKPTYSVPLPDLDNLEAVKAYIEAFGTVAEQRIRLAVYEREVKAIRDLYTIAGYIQETFAKALGITSKTYRKWVEDGLDEEKLDSICSVLHCDRSDICTPDDYISKLSMLDVCGRTDEVIDKLRQLRVLSKKEFNSVATIIDSLIDRHDLMTQRTVRYD